MLRWLKTNNKCVWEREEGNKKGNKEKDVVGKITCWLCQNL